ncbi:NAD(P)H-binding protein [Mucilaginibacter xinganensis]|uniref:NAD-dependent dehydratase n=1 Tax=Mucilaginibacter xinganensis TaxID=1234841 RepID=A0A223P366_9SPHI|nr:NAD(P)H-binding protein [Mucilaginibacter xinganensis]ASU36261.1 NAD-dependent dehydratase [Mucilaginibacter xinganensis]
MKIIITGSLGNISGPLTEQLVKAGHDVTVVSSSANKKADIEKFGASAAIGSVEDIEFLTKTFTGADVVYSMVPQQATSSDYKAFIRKIGQNYAVALKAAGIKNVVNLSSIGAHLSSGTGPIAGMHDAEEILNKLDGVNIKHLRPASFYYNFNNNIGMIKHMGILGGNYPADARIVLVHPKDIADVAFEEITAPFSGTTIRYIASDEKTAGEVTAILGTAIGKPELPWIQFTDEQSVAGMQQAGLSEDVSKNLTEMGTAVRSAILWEDYDKHQPVLSKRKFEDFANEFAENYNK